MPDILIRGMDMPKNEPLRLIINPNGKATVDRGEYYDEFEAVVLSEHGDLVEADHLRTIAYVRGKKYGCVAFVDPIDIAIAPVIVPSNKENKNET